MPCQAVQTRLRKGLRDVRDRAVRHNRRWAGVAMAGLADGDHALILFKHPGFNRAEVWARFEWRWPEIVLSDPGSLEPASTMTVKDAAVRARRRGIEPIRIVALAQMAATPRPKSWDDQPMPILL
jgi:hypothetical protein